MIYMYELITEMRKANQNASCRNAISKIDDLIAILYVLRQDLFSFPQVKPKFTWCVYDVDLGVLISS